MVKRVVYYGSTDNDRDKELLLMAKDYVRKNKGDKFFYILPNGK